MLLKYWLIYVISFVGIFLAMLFILTFIENRQKIRNPPPLKKLPFVSVIIPVYNGGERIIKGKTVDSLLKLDYPKNLYEIIIVDDGSTDNTLKILKKLESSRIKVFTKPNGGKASAINYGIKRAKGEIIAALDDDSFVTPSALMKMIGFFADPEVMSVTPSMLVANKKGILKKVQHVEYLFSIFLRKVFSFMDMIHVTPGPFSLYRRSFFNKYGGFDEDDPTEDTEIAFRIQSYNYRIENSMDAVVYTYTPEGFGALLKQRIRWYSGLIRDAQKYPHLFHPRYGYLAIISLPFAFISVILLLANLGYFTYLGLDSLIQSIRDWYMIGFDVSTIFKGFKLEYLYYTLTSPVTILLLLGIILNLAFILIAKKGSRTKDDIKIGYIYFFALYCYLYALWWVVSFIYYLFGGSIKWGKRYKLKEG